jgi:signal peptidase I
VNWPTPDENPNLLMDDEPEAARTNPKKLFGQPLRSVARPTLESKGGLLKEAIETLLLVIAIYTIVNLSTARFVVEGRSMEPNFFTDEFIIVSRLAYVVGEPERGDVIVFHYDEESGRDFIKRIIGLPGDHIQMKEGKVYVNGVVLNEPYVERLCSTVTCRDREWYVPEGQYFVLGDNRNSSQDSHDFGPINKDQIVGRAWIRYWPPSSWGFIPHHDYDTDIPETPLPTPIPSPTPTDLPGELPDDF